jgi:CBS domain-containing protein
MTEVWHVLRAKNPGVIGVRPTASVREAARAMLETGVDCVVIEQPPDIVGVFTAHDMVRRVVAAGRDPGSTMLAEVMTSPAVTCGPKDDVRRCVRLMADRGIGHLVVVDRNGLRGVISLKDLAGR